MHKNCNDLPELKFRPVYKGKLKPGLSNGNLKPRKTIFSSGIRATLRALKAPADYNPYIYLHIPPLPGIGPVLPLKAEIDTLATHPMSLGKWSGSQADDLLFHNQAARFFNPAEVRLAVSSLLRLDKTLLNAQPKLVVFAGYVGKFSRALQDAGFNVLHTDPIERHARHKGLKNLITPAHQIPQEPGNVAYISYEGYPALQCNHGFYFLLRSIAHTEKGLIVAGGTVRNDTISMNGVMHLKQTYHLGFEVLDTKNYSWYRLFASPKIKEKVSLDLSVFEFILANNKAVATDATGQMMGLPVRNPDAHTISKGLGIPLNKVEKSLRRLHDAWAMGAPFNMMLLAHLRQQTDGFKGFR